MMTEKNILKHLSDSIDQAPIQLLEIIKDQPSVKQLKHDEITRQKKGSPSMKIMTAVASFFVLAALFNFQLQYRTVDSRVYLDVNPSIVIESNKQDKVIGVIALNQDGLEMVEGYNFKGKTTDQVAIDLVDKFVLSDYISKSDDLMLISVYNEDKEKANLKKNEIKAVILDHLAANSIQPVILTQAIDQSNTIKDMAAAYKISEGKLTLIRNLMISSPKLKLDNLANLSLDQLIGLAKYMALDLSQMIEKEMLDQINVSDAIKELYNELDEANDDEDEADYDDEDTSDNDEGNDDSNDDDSDDDESNENDDDDSDEDDAGTTESPATTNALVPKTNTMMSAADARQAVINKFGGIIEKIEYAYDDNNPHYKGEALKDGSKVVFELNARTKVFTKWDIGNDNGWDSFSEALPNMITMNQAANSVISKSGLSNTFVQKIDFKWDDSEPLYQGEAFNKGVKFDFEIDAYSGNFQKWESSKGDETWLEKYSNVK